VRCYGVQQKKHLPVSLRNQPAHGLCICGGDDISGFVNCLVL
jgi:hypothetical protein